MMSSGGDPNPRPLPKIVWGLLVSGIASALLLAGGLKAVQTATIVFALPFTVVTLIMTWSLWRGVKDDWLQEDAKERALNQRMRQIAEKSKN